MLSMSCQIKMGWNHPLLINKSCFKTESSRLGFSNIVFQSILQACLHIVCFELMF